MIKKSLKNKVVLVTGSARGIGKVISLGFLKEGATVIINDINSSELKATRKEFALKGFDILAVKADLTKEKDCLNLIEFIIKEYSRLDILINNVGRGFRGLFEKTSLNVFHKVIQTNLTTAVNITSKALPEIKKSKGSIVFISSVAAVRGLPAYGPYSVSKAAIKSFAQLLRTELSGTGVHVGMLVLGPVYPDTKKRITVHDGESVPVRPIGPLVSKEKVAKTVIKMIHKKTFKKRLNILTSMIYFLHTFFPWALEIILVKRRDPNKYK